MGKIVKHTEIYCDICRKNVTRKVHHKMKVMFNLKDMMWKEYICSDCFEKIKEVIRAGGVDGKE